MVEAPASLRCGSSMDSSIPLPHRALKRSTKGKSNPGELMIVRNLKI